MVLGAGAQHGCKQVLLPGKVGVLGRQALLPLPSGGMRGGHVSALCWSLGVLAALTQRRLPGWTSALGPCGTA